MPEKQYHCSVCGEPSTPERRSYLDLESGLPNLILHDIEIAECKHCGNTDIIMPYPIRIHSAAALAILKSPRRMTGSQLKFLRQHLDLSIDDFSKYLSADPAQVTKWERDEVPLTPEIDRLTRLLAVNLAEDLAPNTSAVVAQLPNIVNESGADWEIHLDVDSLEASHVRAKQAA